jgi:SAM-dependent methyltransferase
MTPENAKVHPFGPLHGALIQHRRAHVLARHLAPRFRPEARVLDVGCGDGELALLLMRQRPDLRLRGTDVLIRHRTHVPVIPFDGQRLPFRDLSFDSVLFVDVLHHTADPDILLAEARRVASHSVVIKDHTLDGFAAGLTLRLMDWVGNAHQGVPLPYNYWPPRRWKAAFEAHGLRVEHWWTRLQLYPFPASLFFCRRLHFIAVLAVGPESVFRT